MSHADTEEDGSYILVEDGTSCENCVHKDVCVYYAGFGDQMANEAQRRGVEPPMDAKELAVICNEFDPVEE